MKADRDASARDGADKAAHVDGSRRRRRVYGASALLAAVVEASPDAIIGETLDGTIVSWNMAAQRMYGYTREEIEGRNVRLLIPADRADEQAGIIASVRSGQRVELETVRVRKDGTPLPVALGVAPLRDGETIIGASSVARDLSERVQLAEVLEKTEQRSRLVAEDAARFRGLVQHAADVILVVDVLGEILYASPALERVTGRAPGQARSIFALIHADDAELARAAMVEAMGSSDPPEPFELRVAHADGTWRHVEAIASNVFDDPWVEGLVINARDVTERKQAEELLAHQALHDPLTGLANRTLLLDRAALALGRAQREHTGVAVLFLDLDGFKLVNDSLGHLAGDELLTTLSDRLRAAVRPGDTVARTGGDEFVVLCEGLAEPAEADRIAGRLLATVAEPVQLRGRKVTVGASIGIALAEDRHTTPEVLLAEADAAMYRAKEFGRGRFELFDATTRRQTLERMELATALREAVDREQLRLLYQPAVALGSSELVAAEALLRWEHPERGLLGAPAFVPIAEEMGIIRMLGAWSIEQVCRDSARRPDLVLSVNVSTQQLADRDLPDVLAGILQRTGAEPSRIRLEVRETAVMRDAEAAVRVLRTVHRLGFQLAIDHFGTGYSSLSYLARLPLHTIKIDGTFVARLRDGSVERAIVRAIIGLARELDLATVAEWVETPAQAELLTALGCGSAQGYLFGAPMPLEQFLGEFPEGGSGRAAGERPTKPPPARPRPEAPRPESRVDVTRA